MLKILFLILMSGGIPVAIAMAGASLIYLLFAESSPPFVVIHRMVSGIDSFPLLAVPFFILAGNLMNNAGITNRIYNYALALVGWLKGGLGHVNVVGSVVFAGMSGTAIADAAGLGTIEIKAMKDHGYPIEVAVGVTAASATCQNRSAASCRTSLHDIFNAYVCNRFNKYITLIYACTTIWQPVANLWILLCCQRGAKYEK